MAISYFTQIIKIIEERICIKKSKKKVIIKRIM